MLMSFDSGVSAEEFQIIVSVRVRTVQPKSPTSRLVTMVGGSQDLYMRNHGLGFCFVVDPDTHVGQSEGCRHLMVSCPEDEFQLVRSRF